MKGACSRLFLAVSFTGHCNSPQRGRTIYSPSLLNLGKHRFCRLSYVRGLESRIAILTYPELEKEGMLHRLREALAENAPDLLVKVLVEVGAKIAAGNR